MKHAILLGFATLSTLLAQAPPAAAPAGAAAPKPAAAVQQDDDPVVAVVEGRAWKRSELERMTLSLGGNIYRQFMNNKREFLKTFGLMQRLATLAEEEKLQEQDPHVWRLMYNRTLYLAQNKMDVTMARTQVTDDEERKYFQAHLSDYSSARLKGILLTFDDPKAKTPRTAVEAEKLAAQLVKEARAGADFGELAAKYSDDEETKGSKGEFPAMKPSDTTVPAQMKTAVFALKPGQVSEPVKLNAGYWVLRLDRFEAQAFEAVQKEVFDKIQSAKLAEWMDKLKADVKVEFKDNAWLDKKER